MKKLACALLLAASTAALHAQDYPTRPIRMMVASTPGSGVDIVARIVGQSMSELLKSPIVVDNRAGGGGLIGVQIAAKAVPDGYTILMAAPSITINELLVKPQPYDILRDFAAIGQATTSYYVIVVNNTVPARSVKELIALAKAKPGELNYGSGGTGNSTHLAGEYFKSLTGANIVHVPYKGSGAALVDLYSGRIQVMFANVVAVLTPVKSGKLRALATSAEKRPSSMPDVPTAIEAGVPGYVVTSWFGLLAPTRTPQPRIAKLNAALLAAMRERDMLERLSSEGAEPVGGTGEAFARHIAAELKIWSKVIKASGL